jgi:hypothetical protein
VNTVRDTPAVERRYNPRKKLNEIVYISLHQDNGGIVLDVSEGGLSFHAAGPIEHEHLVAFRLSIRPLDTVEVVGKLAWKDETGKSGGVEFTNLPDALRNQLSVWLDQPQFAPSHMQTGLCSDEVDRSSPSEMSQAIDQNPRVAVPAIVRPGFSVRTKLFISMAVAAIGLNCLMAFGIRHFVQDRANQELAAEMRKSILVSQAVFQQTQIALQHKAELLSTLAAVTPDTDPTLQESIENPLIMDRNDLAVLADGSNQITALHASDRNMTATTAEEMLLGSLHAGNNSDWWFADGKLYQVVLQSVDHQPLAHNTSGTVVIGRRADYKEVQDLAHILASQVAFTYGGKVVESTLSPFDQYELSRKMQNQSEPQEIQIGQNRLWASSLNLTGGTGPVVGLAILKSLDETTVFMSTLNRLFLQLTAVEAIVLIVLVTFAVVALKAEI